MRARQDTAAGCSTGQFVFATQSVTMHVAPGQLQHGQMMVMASQRTGRWKRARNCSRPCPSRQVLGFNTILPTRNQQDFLIQPKRLGRAPCLLQRQMLRAMSMERLKHCSSESDKDFHSLAHFSQQLVQLATNAFVITKQDLYRKLLILFLRIQTYQQSWIPDFVTIMRILKLCYRRQHS